MSTQRSSLWAARPTVRWIVLTVAACVASTAGCTGEDKIKPVCDEGYGVDADAGLCVRLADSCEANAPTSIRAECAAAHRECVMGQSQAACGACVAGFKDVAGECAPLLKCSSLNCAEQHRECVEADDVAQAACGGCEPGYVRDGDGCVAVRCSPSGSFAGMAAACAGKHRACVETEAGAECGGCWDGYVADGDGCRPAVQCSLLGCVGAGKECLPAEGNRDARCGACLPGRNPDANCAPHQAMDCSTGATGLAAVCAAAHRSCVLKDGRAECGDCDEGYVNAPETGACLREVTCDALDCSATHQRCEPTPSAHCQGCEPFYVAQATDAACRPVLRCQDLSCGDGVECAPETEISDAYCRAPCMLNAVWNGMRCQPCPPCDGPGEDGVWPVPSAGGQCLCKTRPGYFASPGAEIGTYPCDEDGDGWVRESARNPINALDPAIATNARCELRTIDHVELINEAARSRVIELQSPVALYEGDRIDSEALWRARAKVNALPDYGVGVLARDLNRMTKLCHTPTGDYNDNGVSDIREHAALEPGPTLLDEQRTFNTFSYFMELHWGRYEPPESFRMHGRYVVREKTRRADGGEFAQFRVPMVYPSLDGSHYRDCRVARDSAWEGSPDVGFDFAQFEPADGWDGMNHHSQYKCLMANDGASADDAGQIRRAALAANYRINRCAASVRSTAGAVGGPTVRCDLLDVGDVQGGDVVWGAARYLDHRRMGTAGEQLFAWNLGTATYTRGCVNDCVDEIKECTGFGSFADAIACTYDAQDFGRFLACEASEICDAKDNDSDDQIDEDNPGGGSACDSGLEGRCQAGHLQCTQGSLICQADREAQPEDCNNLDDDCDGLVDENVGAGPSPTLCTVKTGNSVPRQGICGQGVLLCDDGSYSKCHPTLWDDGTHWDGTNPDEVPGKPLIEVGCNALDDDCDGRVDECPVTAGVPGEHCPAYDLSLGSSCDPGWSTYFQDFDGDRYPAKSLLGTAATCRCDRPSGYISQSEAHAGQDCCDSCSNGAPLSEAARVNPGQTGFTPDNTCCEDLAGGSVYDFNCDHKQETALNTYVPSPCFQVWTSSGTQCWSVGAGWLQSDAVKCGGVGLWHIGACRTDYFLFWVTGCTALAYPRKQECR